MHRKPTVTHQLTVVPCGGGVPNRWETPVYIYIYIEFIHSLYIYIVYIYSVYIYIVFICVYCMYIYIYMYIYMYIYIVYIYIYMYMYCNFHIWFQPPGHDNILRTPVIQTLSGIHQHNNIAFQRQSRLREQGQAGGRVFRHCLFLAIVVAPQTGSALGSLERDEAVLNAWRHSLQSKAISWVSGIHLVAAANWENWRSDLGSFLGQLTILWQQHHLFGHLVYITDLCSANHIGSGAAKAQHPGRWKQQVVVMVAAVQSQISWLHWYHHLMELVTAAWPKGRYTELVTRLILNCSGSAFAKLQLNHQELLANEEKSVHKLIELLGGSWGKVELENQYDDAEQALFNTVQRGDESHDSYLARADVAWSRLLSRRLNLEELQAYIVLRGSGLTPEEKKRVILDADQSSSGKLTMKRVHEAVRLLGASFFMDMTGQKRNNRTKVYTQETLVAQDNHEEPEDPTFWTNDEMTDEDYIDSLVQAGDEDATLVADFEEAAAEALQEEPSLASAYTAYQEARRRLAEKARNRGFWAVSKNPYNSGNSKGKQNFSKGGSKGKSGFSGGRGRRSLQDRIMNSHCRICGRKGHWRAECPQRGQSSQSTAAGSTTSTSMPTTNVVPVTEEGVDALPLEFLQLPVVHESTLDEETRPTDVLFCSCLKGNPSPPKYPLGRLLNVEGSPIQNNPNENDMCFMRPSMSQLHNTLRRRASEQSNRCRNKLRNRVQRQSADQVSLKVRVGPQSASVQNKVKKSPVPPVVSMTNPQVETSDDVICFATHGTHGVLDLGASKTVIGSEFVPSLIQGLQECIPGKIRRCSCRITFRFGNQGTLTSEQALVIPIGKLMLKVAIVPGRTPFLLSNSLMRALEARIDCRTYTLMSPMFTKEVPLDLTSRGLFLLDVCKLIHSASVRDAKGQVVAAETGVETHIAHEEESCRPIGDQGQHAKSVQANSQTSAETNNGPIKGLSSNDLDKGDKVKGVIASRVQPAVHSSSEYQRVSVAQHVNKWNIITQMSTNREHPQIVVQDLPSEDPTHRSIAKSHVQPIDPEPAIEECTRTGWKGRSGSHDDGTAVAGASDVRSQVCQPHIPAHVGQPPRVDSVHGRSLCQQREEGPPKVDAIRESEAAVCGECPGPDASHAKGESVPRITGTTGKVQGNAPAQAKGQGVFDFSGISRRSSLRNAYQRPVGGGLRGHRCSTRVVLPGDYDGRFDPRECRGDADQDHPDRASSPAGHPTPGESHAQPPGRPPPGPELVRVDNLTDPCLSASHETAQVHSIIQQITQELQSVLSRTRPMGKAYTLAEVFCSSRSPLTQQVNALGQKAIRFGYDQGDLATVEGRVALFTQIAVHRPEHVWFSPTCGPWSSWTNLNMSRSLEHFHEYQQKREDLLYQIALGIVLCRHQVSHGKHMHWEQPGRSLMVRLPCMQEIHHYTQACQFDMCRAGSLVDPVSHIPIRKSMVLLTTSKRMYHRFHGLTCLGNHEHQSIEGSVMHGQHRVLRSQYTEVYPRKFARAAAQIMCHNKFERPLHWNQIWPLLNAERNSACESDEALVAEPQRSADKFPKSELLTPVPLQEADPKRRRVDGKQPPVLCQELVQEVIDQVAKVLPRVGRMQITSPNLLRGISNILPDKDIVQVIACRGTDRTVGPPTDLHRDEAPYRRSIMLMRNTGELKIERY